MSEPQVVVGINIAYQPQLSKPLFVIGTKWVITCMNVSIWPSHDAAKFEKLSKLPFVLRSINMDRKKAASAVIQVLAGAHSRSHIPASVTLKVARS